MIIVLAGTAEGRKVVELLKSAGLPVTATAVSAYGADLLKEKCPDEVLEGCLDKQGLKELIQGKEAAFLVDATHPFASLISELAMEAACELDVKYIRLERREVELLDHPLVSRIQDLEEIKYFLRAKQVVFSTIGSKNLPRLAPMVNEAGARLIARVLPTSQVIKGCEELGLSPDQILALKGPFSKDLNKQLMLHYGADLVLTKETGTIGGFDTKIQAALELALPTVVWCRPKLNYPVVLTNPEEVVEYIRSEKKREE